MIKVIAKHYNVNRGRIEDYDVLDRKDFIIKQLKKKCATKAEFFDKIKTEFMWRYWSKAEWELIITKTEEGRIILTPWCGCLNPDSVAVDVTDDSSFDWVGFADEHIRAQIFKNRAKIDVYDQIVYDGRLSRLVDELWHTRLPYERDNPKFHED